MLNSTELNQEDQLILKTSSRRVGMVEQYKDLESAPIYRTKRSSKKVKLSLVSNHPFNQLKLCYICHKSCVIKLCKCDDIRYHPDCILQMIKRPSFSLQTLQCPYCLCFFKTEIKNKKFQKRSCYQYITLFILGIISIIFVLIGTFWKKLSTPQIIILFILQLLLALFALLTFQKIKFIALDWKLVIVGNERYDSEAFQNAKLIFQAYHTQTAQYLNDSQIE